MVSLALSPTPFAALLSSTSTIKNSNHTSHTYLPVKPIKPLCVGRRKFLPPLSVAAPPNPTTSSSQEEAVQERDPSEIEIEIQDTEEGSPSKFTWRDHWYPVSLIEDLDPSLPTAFQLLNRDLVLWFDKSSSQWVAFDDKCAHRLAPLSVSSENSN